MPSRPLPSRPLPFPPETRRGGRWGVWLIRYGVGWILVAAGVILLIVSPGGFGVEGFGMSVGSGLSVLMLNWLYRLGVAGNEEREREEAARRYLAEHGRWPDERRRDEPDPPPLPAAPERRTPPAEAAAHHSRRTAGPPGRDRPLRRRGAG